MNLQKKRRELQTVKTTPFILIFFLHCWRQNLVIIFLCIIIQPWKCFFLFLNINLENNFCGIHVNILFVEYYYIYTILYYHLLYWIIIILCYIIYNNKIINWTLINLDKDRLKISLISIKMVFAKNIWNNIWSENKSTVNGILITFWNPFYSVNIIHSLIMCN